MLKSLRDEWLAALRSGKYAKTTGQLRTTKHSGEQSFCCLGVLCNVMDPNRYIADNDQYHFANGDISVAGIVPPVADELRLSDRREYSFYDNTPVSASIDAILVHMNDGESKSFAEIADWIEANVPVEEDPNTDKPSPVIDLEYLESILDSFKNDPADTPYQLGYLMAIVELYKNIGGDLFARYGNDSLQG